MQPLDRIDGASQLLRRVDAVLAMMLQVGPDARLGQVMETNGLIRDEIGRALAILEGGDQESASLEGTAGLAPAAVMPAQGGAEVLTLRPSLRG